MERNAKLFGENARTRTAIFEEAESSPGYSRLIAHSVRTKQAYFFTKRTVERLPVLAKSIQFAKNGFDFNTEVLGIYDA